MRYYLSGRILNIYEITSLRGEDNVLKECQIDGRGREKKAFREYTFFLYSSNKRHDTTHPILFTSSIFFAFSSPKELFGKRGIFFNKQNYV